MVYRCTSSTTTSLTNDSHILSGISADSIQREPQTSPASREAVTRKCNVEGCSKIYTGGDSANSLARHKREKHSNRSSFTCPVPFCGHGTWRLHNLRVHWEKKHKIMAMPEWLIATQARGGGGVKRKREPSATD
jgi:hypothetical protein